MSETPALVVDVSLARSMVEPLYRDLTLPTGENVMQHADGIASILREVRDDPELISAAYLFCVPSVIQNSGEWIEKSFGPAVNGLVQELGQVNELSRRARSENEEANTRHQVEAMRRMFLSMCKDLRVVLLKLASRLQTLRWFAASKREGAEKFGTETLDLYAPLANRLGIWQLKWELEDLSLRFTRPSEYREIAQQLDESREQRIEFMQSAVLRIRGLLEENGIKAEVSGRPKHIYSIWKKMQRKHLRFDQLFDVRAVRIIVDTVERCYQVLSIVHENFPVISKEYDDYIAKPKPNGYQSLHTVVTDKAGRPLEIQIRTRAMHEFAELGVAAHWRYKEAGNSNGATSAEEQRVAWLRQLLAWGSDMQNQGQPEGEAVLDDHIYALTPQGRVVELPRGGTPVDFAYAVHTQLGHRCRGAKVNGAIVPLTHKLKTGDTVEIITDKNRRPSRDWLKIVKSTQAKNKINQWFRSELKEENIQHGKDLIAAYAKAKGINFAEINKPEYQEKIRRKYGFHDWNSCLATVGHGGLKESQIVNRMYDEYKKDHVVPVTDADVLGSIAEKQQAAAGTQPEHKSKSGIVVHGLYDVAVHFSKCCNPVPGDEIVGFVTRGRGISIHRTDCVNIINLSKIEKDRLIEAEWQDTALMDNGAEYQADLKIFCHDRPGLLVDITKIFTEKEINISGIQSKTSKQGIATIEVFFNIKGRDQIKVLVEKLRQIESVIDVERTTG